MTADDLKALIQKGEGETVDLTREMSTRLRREIGSRLAALANTEGGYLILGVDSAKNIVGCTLHDDERAQISQAAKNCRPVLPIEIEDVNIDGKNLVVVTVRKAPYLHSDGAERFPCRIGDSYTFMDAFALIRALNGRGLLEEPSGPDFSSLFKSDMKPQPRVPPSREELAPVLAMLQSDPHENQAFALQRLAHLVYRERIESDDAVLQAVDRLSMSSNPTLQRLAVRLLSAFFHLTPPQDQAPLTERFLARGLMLLHTTTRDMRAEVITWVGAIADTRAGEALVSLIPILPDEEVPEGQPPTVAYALKMRRDRNAIERRLMDEAVKETDGRVRLRLLKCLEEIRHRGTHQPWDRGREMGEHVRFTREGPVEHAPR